jgi:hypothetical protein
MKEPKSEAANRSGSSALASALGSAIVWQGDLEDDCWAKVGNLLVDCECLGCIEWNDDDEEQQEKHKSEYWHCSVGPVNEKHMSTGPDIFHSGEPGGLILGGSMARAIAEAILKSPNIVSIYPKGRLARHLVGKLDLSSCLSRTRYARKEVRIENSKCVGRFVGKVHP